MSRCLRLARRSLLAAFVLIASSAQAQAAGERRQVIIDQDMFGPGGSNMNSVLMLLQAPDVVRGIGTVDRANLAKYLTIAKLRLENAIAVVRSNDGG